MLKTVRCMLTEPRSCSVIDKFINTTVTLHVSHEKKSNVSWECSEKYDMFMREFGFLVSCIDIISPSDLH